MVVRKMDPVVGATYPTRSARGWNNPERGSEYDLVQFCAALDCDAALAGTYATERQEWGSVTRMAGGSERRLSSLVLVLTFRSWQKSTMSLPGGDRLYLATSNVPNTPFVRPCCGYVVS